MYTYLRIISRYLVKLQTPGSGLKRLYGEASSAAVLSLILRLYAPVVCNHGHIMAQMPFRKLTQTVCCESSTTFNNFPVSTSTNP